MLPHKSGQLHLAITVFTYFHMLASVLCCVCVCVCVCVYVYNTLYKKSGQTKPTVEIRGLTMQIHVDEAKYL